MSEHKVYFTWGGNTLIFGDQDGYKWAIDWTIGTWSFTSARSNNI